MRDGDQRAFLCKEWIGFLYLDLPIIYIFIHIQQMTTNHGEYPLWWGLKKQRKCRYPHTLNVLELLKQFKRHYIHYHFWDIICHTKRGPRHLFRHLLGNCSRAIALLNTTLIPHLIFEMACVFSPLTLYFFWTLGL